MSSPIRDRATASPLPTDITARAAIYRHRGLIASLLAAGFAAWWTHRQLERIARHSRGSPPTEVPDYLRADLGLPPARPRYSEHPPRQFPPW